MLIILSSIYLSMRELKGTHAPKKHSVQIVSSGISNNSHMYRSKNLFRCFLPSHIINLSSQHSLSQRTKTKKKTKISGKKKKANKKTHSNSNNKKLLSFPLTFPVSFQVLSSNTNNVQISFSSFPCPCPSPALSTHFIHDLCLETWDTETCPT